MKQDRNGVRTAQDLERKYDFSTIKKAVEQSEQSLTKVENELYEFMVATIQTEENLQSQIDGNITTYYYSGVPTLSNLPASEWTTDEEKNRHLGDLYFNKDTGYAYRFYIDSDTSVYGWTKITDSDVTEALALANAAKDTADGKRRVFLVQPTPPYDSGDLWLNNEEIYVCQISKASGSFATNDFIIATKYTDDTLATQVEDQLTITKNQVTVIQENQNGINVTITETTNLVDKLTGEVASEIDERKAMLRLQSEDGVPVVELGTTTSPVKTKYKSDGMYIEDNGVITGYFKNGKAYNHDMKVIKTFEIGNDFSFVIEDDDSLSLV